MAKNKLSDLNDHLFAQLERLGEEDMTAEKLELEVKRAEAITDLAKGVVDITKVTVDALKVISNGQVHINKLPQQLGISDSE